MIFSYCPRLYSNSRPSLQSPPPPHAYASSFSLLRFSQQLSALVHSNPFPNLHSPAVIRAVCQLMHLPLSRLLTCNELLSVYGSPVVIQDLRASDRSIGSPCLALIPLSFRTTQFFFSMRWTIAPRSFSALSFNAFLAPPFQALSTGLSNFSRRVDVPLLFKFFFLF